MSNVRLLSGVNASGRYVHISQVTSGITSLQCPFCGGGLTAKKGGKMSHHFAHNSESCFQVDHRDFSKLELPIYDRFNIYISAKAWQELQRFHISSGASLSVLYNHDPPLIRQGFDYHRTPELTDEGKIPFGEATLSKFSEFQIGMVYMRHNQLSDVARLAYFGEPRFRGWGKDSQQIGWLIKPARDTHDFAIADLNIFRSQVERFYGLHLYLLKIVHADGELYKIGVTSRDVDERIKEIRRDLRDFIDVKSIKVDRLCEHRGAVERYAQHRYRSYQKLIGNHTEYFEFPKKFLRNVRRDFTSLGDLHLPTDGWYFYDIRRDEPKLGEYTRNGLLGQILAQESAYIESVIREDEYIIRHREATSAGTKAGLARARERGVTLGRPKDTEASLLKRHPQIVAALQEGTPIKAIARNLKVGRNTVRRVRDALRAKD
ncbi:MAG: GIY-YIG nuclease family protein [Chloroflexota bacterium]